MISSASLWLSTSTQGHITIADNRLKAADILEGNLKSHRISDPMTLDPQTRFHVLNHAQIRGTEVDSENNPARDDIATVGKDVDMPRGPHGVRGVAKRDLIHFLKQPRHSEARIAAHRHRSRSGMRILSRQRDLRPSQPLAVGDDTDVFLFGLQDRALLDVQFKEGVHLARTEFFLTFPANAGQFVLKAFVLCIRAIIGPVLTVDAGKNTGR